MVGIGTTFYYHNNNGLLSYDIIFYCGNKACLKLSNILILNTLYDFFFHQYPKD